ncbi:hypothetical protein [Prosthecobacter sp.]|uniref:hypothetical protein n=1 Tax=Prosthecobacter sp. TaxID=1965333 RepID=UPI0037847144
MLEPICLFLAYLFEVLITIADPLISFFLGILSLDQSLTQNSPLGESPQAREARRSWRNCGLGCLILLLLATFAAGLAWWAWE